MSKRKLPENNLGSEERYFLNPKSVSEHLYCSVCQDVFVEPQRAPCGHSYCRTCIHMWLKNSRTCPEDRKPLKVSDLHHDFILENIIGDQMVACNYRNRGCDFVGQLQTLKSHKSSCCFNPENLPSFLKADPSSESLPHVLPDADVSSDESEDEAVLPQLAQPSLRMRLYKAGGEHREMLSSMFEKQDALPKSKRYKDS